MEPVVHERSALDVLPVRRTAPQTTSPATRRRRRGPILHSNSVSFPANRSAIAMPDLFARRNTKHFWIKIMPPRHESGAIVHGTLICEDSEAEIFDEAIGFIYANSNYVKNDWLIDILRPSGLLPICRAQPVAKFVKTPMTS
jgi:hypothetical protein